MSKLQKLILNGQVKEDSFYRHIVPSSGRDFAPVTRHFWRLNCNILYAADFNYLIRWVIVTYILLDISVVSSHDTSAYECELLAVTWHYLPSVRLGNARSGIRPRKRRLNCLHSASCKHGSSCIFTRSKLIASFVFSEVKQ